MNAFIVAALLAVVSLGVQAKEGGPKVQWQKVKHNVTVTAEVSIDILVKNYDSSGDLHGTLKIALFGKDTPMTVLNFFSICNGVKRPSGTLKYGGTHCHRMIKDMNFQCGDITVGDGSGGVSIFGDIFNDENFDIGLSEKGTLAMANRGPNTNGSQFFILFRAWQFLDNNHVAFGQVIGKESLDFLDKLREINVENDGLTPKKRVKIVDCLGKEVKNYKIVRTASVNDDNFE